ncbi:MAG: helix-turn-helix domain-containing protein [Bacillota bacterium]
MDIAVTRFLTESGRHVEEARLDMESRVLTDCFDLLRLLGLCRKDVCVLLLDEEFRVLGAHSDHPQPDGMVGKGFDMLYKQGIVPHRVTKFIKGPDEGGKVYLYFYCEPGEAGMPGYHLCSITEREEDDVLSVYLANTARSMRHIARVVNRYAGGSADRPEDRRDRLPGHLPGHMPDDRAPVPAGSGFISEREQMSVNRKAVVETLKSTGGNKRRAAQILGISRQTIYRLLRD